ncbi:unnamed protein product, partial [Prorocentrum cordatum]
RRGRGPGGAGEDGGRRLRAQAARDAGSGRRRASGPGAAALDSAGGVARGVQLAAAVPRAGAGGGSRPGARSRREQAAAAPPRGGRGAPPRGGGPPRGRAGLGLPRGTGAGRGLLRE